MDEQRSMDEEDLMQTLCALLDKTGPLIVDLTQDYDGREINIISLGEQEFEVSLRRAE